MSAAPRASDRARAGIAGPGGATPEPGAPTPAPGRPARAVVAITAALALVGAILLAAHPWHGRAALPPPVGDRPIPTGTASGPYRAFSPTSYWNTPLPADAPIAPDSAAVVSFIERDNQVGHLVLTGAGPKGRWGHPIYWAEPGDPTYRVGNDCSFSTPAAFSAVRIPLGARPDPGSDADMTVYDIGRGLVYGFWKARYDVGSNSWSACGGTAYSLSSNGLDGGLAQSDDSANAGHRGLPPPVYAVRFDEIKAGVIDHVLRINVNTTGCSHVFPMTGDECGTHAPAAPPEGARVRLDPSIDLAGLHLSPGALVIARALQRYGAVIGDQTGGAATIQLEDVVAEGRGWLWKGVLGPDALRKLPLGDLQVIAPGFGS